MQRRERAIEFGSKERAVAFLDDHAVGRARHQLREEGAAGRTGDQHVQIAIPLIQRRVAQVAFELLSNPDDRQTCFANAARQLVGRCHQPRSLVRQHMAAFEEVVQQVYHDQDGGSHTLTIAHATR